MLKYTGTTLQGSSDQSRAHHKMLGEMKVDLTAETKVNLMAAKSATWLATRKDPKKARR